MRGKIYREKRCKGDMNKRIKIHKVLFFSNQICCGMVVNRDENTEISQAFLDKWNSTRTNHPIEIHQLSCAGGKVS